MSLTVRHCVLAALGPGVSVPRLTPNAARTGGYCSIAACTVRRFPAAFYEQDNKSQSFLLRMNIQRKPGDWNCKYCQHLNFSRRDFCQKCRNPRSDLQFNDGHGTGGVLTSLDIRPGDWYCTCGYHNFASRSSCFSCGTIVRDFPAGQGAAGAEGGRDSAAVRAGWKAGDWICARPGCNVHNFASRTECYRCNAPRESGPGK